MIANRFKRVMSFLNSPMQVSFLPGHQITNNIIITKEVIHSVRHMKGKKRFMAIKVDLEKAYDRLCWNFILGTLLDAGFPMILINVIMKCLAASSIRVS